MCGVCEQALAGFVDCCTQPFVLPAGGVVDCIPCTLQRFPTLVHHRSLRCAYLTRRVIPFGAQIDIVVVVSTHTADYCAIDNHGGGGSSPPKYNKQFSLLFDTSLLSISILFFAMTPFPRSTCGRIAWLYRYVVMSWFIHLFLYRGECCFWRAWDVHIHIHVAFSRGALTFLWFIFYHVRQ